MIINPYYAECMKKQGIKIDDLEIIEHFFIPTEEDLEKITKHLKDCKEIVDIGSGYGLLINELAKRNPGKSFLGIDTMYWDKKFQLPKAEKNVRFEFNGIEAMTSKRFNKKRKKFDGVICCWMPDGSDWREMMSYLAKKKIVLILSRHFATGTTAVYTGMKQFGFNMEEAWTSDRSVIQIWKRGVTKEIKCPYCGYSGGPEHGTNMPFIEHGVPKIDCAKCTRRFVVKELIEEGGRLIKIGLPLLKYKTELKK